MLFDFKAAQACIRTSYYCAEGGVRRETGRLGLILIHVELENDILFSCETQTGRDGLATPLIPRRRRGMMVNRPSRPDSNACCT